MFRREKILTKLKQHAPELIATGVVAIGVAMYIKSRRAASGLDWTEAITSESSVPEQGIVIPWTMIHELIDRGSREGGGALMTIKENVDDVFDSEFVIKFVGMVPREQ